MKTKKEENTVFIINCNELTEKQVKSILLSMYFEKKARKEQLKDCENRGYYMDKSEEITYLKNRIKELEELEKYISE